MSGQPHGTRARYLRYCRCLPCRAANARYQSAWKATGPRQRRIAAYHTREHILALSRCGIGRQWLSDISGVSTSTIGAVKRGQRWIWQRVAESLFRVDRHALAPGHLVPATRTLRLINELLEEGFSKAELARRLGKRRTNGRSPQLAVRPHRTTAKMAIKIERLWRQLTL